MIRTSRVARTTPRGVRRPRCSARWICARQVCIAPAGAGKVAERRRGGGLGPGRAGRAGPLGPARLARLGPRRFVARRRRRDGRRLEIGRPGARGERRLRRVRRGLPGRRDGRGRVGWGQVRRGGRGIGEEGNRFRRGGRIGDRAGFGRFSRIRVRRGGGRGPVLGQRRQRRVRADKGHGDGSARSAGGRAGRGDRGEGGEGGEMQGRRDGDAERGLAPVRGRGRGAGRAGATARGRIRDAGAGRGRGHLAPLLKPWTGSGHTQARQHPQGASGRSARVGACHGEVGIERHAEGGAVRVPRAADHRNRLVEKLNIGATTSALASVIRNSAKCLFCLVTTK